MYSSEFIFFHFSTDLLLFIYLSYLTIGGRGFSSVSNSPSHSGVHFVEQAGFEVQTSACLCFRVHAL